ncbi:hypothetical protein GF345_05010 [Candidatus Woesearchaeota archaeon]|nr:hypothetical protein [Candidatus Woesearchaeota archaeon]
MEDYVFMDVLQRKQQEINDVMEKFESYEKKKTKTEKARSYFRELSKKALFITSVPFYWFILFKYVVGSFNPAFFVFVVLASGLLSFTGSNWGVLNVLR